LDRRRMQVEQRQRLADHHVAGGELPPRELVAAGQKVVVAIRLVDQLAAVAPVERLEVVLRVAEQRVPRDVVAIDVPPATQREIELREVGIEDDVLELRVARPRHGAPPRSPPSPRPGSIAQSSITRSPPTATHGRSTADDARASVATL